MQDRRDFLKSVTLASFGVALGPGKAMAAENNPVTSVVMWPLPVR